MLIREVRLDDAKEFMEMQLKIDDETRFMLFEPGERKTSEEKVKSILSDKIDSGSLVLVIEDQEKLVGFLSAQRGFAKRTRHSAYIVCGIQEAYCSKGLGSKMFKKLEEWAVKNGVTKLELTVMLPNRAGLALYQKMGFKIEGTKEKSCIIDGEYVDEYYMGKVLNVL